MDKKIVARENISSTKCVLQEDGSWKVTSTIYDKALLEGETEWIEETVEAMSFDSDVQRGVQTTMGSTLNYLTQTVYQNGFRGLIEYREYERSLDAARKGNMMGRVEA